MFCRSAATFLERVMLQSPEASRDRVYRTLQGFLRHENLATTMRYLEADPSRQERAMEAFARALPSDGAGGGRFRLGSPTWQSAVRILWSGPSADPDSPHFPMVQPVAH
jgi:hypothetical protein